MALYWDEYQRMRRVEAWATKLGFEFKTDVYGGNMPTSIIVRPADGELLVYNRDATLFRGSMEEIEIFFKGIEWARTYDRVIKLSDENKRAKKESVIRNQHLLKTLKTGTLHKRGSEWGYDDEDEEIDETL